MDDRLDGWGEITAHLGMDRKTVLARGYPVHYELTGRVFARTGELDSFMRRVPTSSHVLPDSPISPDA